MPEAFITDYERQENIPICWTQNLMFVTICWVS